MALTMASNLSEVYEILKSSHSNSLAIEVSIRTIKMNEQGELIIQGARYKSTKMSDQWLAAQSHISLPIFLSFSTKLQSLIVNETLDNSGNSRNVKVKIRDNSVIGLASAGLPDLTPLKIVQICEDVAPKEVQSELVVKQFAHMEDKGIFRVTLVSPNANYEVQKDDIVSAGINISYHYNTKFSLQISTALFRLACLNGMVIPICSKKNHLNVSRIKRGHRQDTADIERKIMEIGKESWSDLDNKLKALAEYRKYKVNAKKILNAIVNKRRYSKQLRNKLMKALEQDEVSPIDGEMGTLLDIINALSRVGTHDKEIQKSRFARELVRLAGHISQEHYHVCSSCGSFLNSLN